MSCGKPCACPSYRAHLLSISVAPSATPSRAGGAFARQNVEMEKRWSADHAAYRRMVADGLQPKTLDGAAYVEAHAKNEADVELGMGMSEHVEVVREA